MTPSSSAWGAGLPYFTNVPGESLGLIYSASEYLTRANLMRAYSFPDYDTPIVRGKTVCVVGGGNVAMDLGADRAAARGRERLHRLPPFSRQEMPARAEEIHHAEEEGHCFQVALTAPIEYLGDDRGDGPSDARCQEMELGEPDASGRRRPDPQTRTPNLRSTPRPRDRGDRFGGEPDPDAATPKGVDLNKSRLHRRQR